jgi:hypothetical protein
MDFMFVLSSLRPQPEAASKILKGNFASTRQGWQLQPALIAGLVYKAFKNHSAAGYACFTSKFG